MRKPNAGVQSSSGVAGSKVPAIPSLSRIAACALLLSAWGFLAPLPAVGATNLPPCCRQVEPVTSYSDKSLYQLDSLWTSDVNRQVRLGVLQGRPQVLAMFFTSCQYACPIIVHDMKRIQETLPQAVRDTVDFVLVSFDTDRDTPVVLREYRQRQDLEPAHWTLLTGKPDDVRELAALLGVKYQKDARGQFSHSNVITILNPQGEIAFQQVGLNKDPADTVGAIERTLTR